MNERDLRVHSAPSSWSRRPSGCAFRRRALGASLSTLLLALCLLLCLLGAAVAAGAAQASAPLRPAAQGLQLLPLSFGFGPAGITLTPAAARTASPARPATEAPRGTITPLRPTVRWSAVRGASRYDLRIYEGNRLLRTMNGIRAHSWRVRKALPANVALSWKVRGRNAAGAGRWSKGLDFVIGVPAPQAPSGTIATATPAFTWNKLTGAAKYEVSVSGGTLALTKSGLTGLSYKFAQALPQNVALTWKVRGSNADGKGAWSKSMAFTIAAAPSADLSGLALSGSPSNYSFAAATYAYSGVSVLNGVDSVTVTPTGSGVITVQGTTVASGSASDPITLTAGTAKTITVVATQAGKSAKTYTIEVTRNSAAQPTPPFDPAQATPTFDPAAGAVAWGSGVTISSSGADAIYYTTDGSTPTRSSTNQATTPLVINAAETVKALAVKAGADDSLVGSAAYTQAATPDLTGLALSGSPSNYSFAAATYAYSGVSVLNGVDSVTVTPTGSGVITVQGTTVASGSASDPITLTAGTAKTITVVATQAGKSAKTYTIEVTRNSAAPATPSFDPAAGAVAWGSGVTISSSGADAIYYTTDGSTPMRSSTNQATTPLVINAAETVKALAVKAGADDSLVGVAAYTQAATKYVVTSSSYAPVAGGVVTISAQLADASGNPVSTAGEVVTWTKSDPNGSFATATSTTNASGVATVAFTTHTVAGTATTVTAADAASLTGVSGAITTVAGALDHFDFVLASPQISGSVFTGTNTLTAKDANGNTVDFDASTNNVTITTTAGTISGIHSGAVLNAASDFSSGVADLTTLGMTFTGTAGDYVFTATSATGSYTGISHAATIDALAIGDAYQGGVVAYILQSGDPGYVAGVTSGLITATADQTSDSGIMWALPTYESTLVPGGTATELGTGAANTAAIIAQNGAGSTAAGLARAYNGGGYDDWYLPSKDELNQLYVNRAAIGGFDTTAYPYHYWSSSEYTYSGVYDAGFAWFCDFNDGTVGGYYKANPARVRAVRSFPAAAATQYLVTSSSYGPVAGTAVTIHAQLADANGNAVSTAGNSVAWTNSGSGGSFTTTTTSTNSKGIATATFTTGTTVGTYAVTATTGAVAGTSTDITSIAGVATKYIVTSTNYVPEPDSQVTISAQLADADGNAVHTSGKVVTWTSTNGGSFAALTSTTTDLGIATVGYTTSEGLLYHVVTATDTDNLTGFILLQWPNANG